MKFLEHINVHVFSVHCSGQWLLLLWLSCRHNIYHSWITNSALSELYAILFFDIELVKIRSEVSKIPLVLFVDLCVARNFYASGLRRFYANLTALFELCKHLSVSGTLNMVYYSLPTCRNRDDSRVWSRGWSKCEQVAHHTRSTAGSVRGKMRPRLAWCSDRRSDGSTRRTGPPTLYRHHDLRPYQGFAANKNSLLKLLADTSHELS